MHPDYTLVFQIRYSTWLLSSSGRKRISELRIYTPGYV